MLLAFISYTLKAKSKPGQVLQVSRNSVNPEKQIAFRKPVVKYSLYSYVLATDDVVETSGESRNEEKRNIPYPKQIFCIISMEACERFSFYGMNSKRSL